MGGRALLAKEAGGGDMMVRDNATLTASVVRDLGKNADLDFYVNGLRDDVLTTCWFSLSPLA
jgi:hypothetical protein